jgi:succinyl-CoA synthetase beta subunit
VNLIEYHAKRLFAEHGIPIPDGELAFTPAEAREAGRKLGGKAVVKAQVLTGGRGKAGGVKLGFSLDEIESHAEDILGLDIKGFTVHKVLVDALAPGGIDQEFYLAISVDRASRKPLLIASAAGGMDIEEVAATTPEKIIRLEIEPLIGWKRHHSTYVASRLGLDQSLWGQFHKVVAGLYDCFVAKDAMLTEINPLALTGEGVLMAVDGKMTIDDNALPRHPELEALREADELTENEQRAKEAGINYIQLDGNIGCMVNGAGLAMTSMDVIQYFGGAPANFLDIGGGAKAEQVAAALNIILNDPDVKAVMINIFGGITRCDEVARGILSALEMIDTDVPFVTRLAGTNAAEGRALLAEANMETAVTLSDAAKTAIAAAAAYAGGAA